MYLMADGLTRLLAPILSFTADELWRYLPGAREESVHMALFPDRREPRRARRSRRWSSAGTRWSALRERVLAEIEPLRKNKQIGSSLQAKVVISATAGGAARCSSSTRSELPMLFIVSEVELRPAPTDVEAHDEAMPRVDDRARRRREMRALLAHTCRRSRASRRRPGCASAARTRWPRRSMDNAHRGRVGGAASTARRAAAAASSSWLPMVIVAVDQATKAMVRATLPLHDSVTVIPGLLDLTHVRTAARRSASSTAPTFRSRRVIIAVIATAALIGVGVYAASLAHHQLVARIGLALIIGGAAGNLIDRVVAGSVVDFVDVYWRTHHFWAFNVADSAITVGVAMHDSRYARRQERMYPRLFELPRRRITVYTYGVLLAAAYLLGLKLAMVRAKARGLDADRVLDLGIYIIISALDRRQAAAAHHRLPHVHAPTRASC